MAECETWLYLCEPITSSFLIHGLFSLLLLARMLEAAGGGGGVRVVKKSGRICDFVTQQGRELIGSTVFFSSDKYKHDTMKRGILVSEIIT